jgi:septal ring factor EnvC (AmiA/AmiB activator)
MRSHRAIAPFVFVLAAGALPASAQQGAPGRAGQSEIERLLVKAEAEERALAAELEEARPRLDVTRRRIVARGRGYYRLVRAGLLPAGGGFDALVDHAAHVERTRRALGRDVTTEAALAKRVVEIEARLARLRAERGPLELQREALERARVALQVTDERRAAFSRAFETSVRPDAVAIYGTDLGPAAEERAGFRALKGRLPFPIAGRAEVNRVHRSGGPAVDLVAPTGSAVRSVAAGRVAFADRQDEYGLTVILDHGDHYYSLYASLGSADVHIGDSVSAGARIGTVGSVDGTPPRCTFEIRHKASTLDPGPWLGL